MRPTATAVLAVALTALARRVDRRLARRPARQQPPSTAGMVRKGKAPVSNDVLQGQAAAARRKPTSPNGLHLMVLEDHRLPRVSFQIIIPGAGGYYDPAAMIGLSGLHRADDARGHDDEVVAADLAGRSRRWRPIVNVGSGTSATVGDAVAAAR